MLPPSDLCDEDGPIPTFPPRELDGRGKLVPLSPEEEQARRLAVLRTLAASPEADPPGTAEALMRGIDSHRDADAKLFEGMH